MKGDQRMSRRRWGWMVAALLTVGGVAGALAAVRQAPRRAEVLSPYARLLAEVKQDEAQARAEIADAVRAHSDAERADRLVRVADRHRLAGESTRQAFVKAADSLRDDRDRSRVLRKLLAAAPITEETGREVLRAVANTRSEAERLRMLMSFHSLQESELVRGPLAGAYLDVAADLESSQALGEALRGLLHPTRLASEHTQRALELAARLTRDEDRMKVLREVTDHQALSREVLAGYRAVEAHLGTELRRLARQRREAARDGSPSERRGGPSVYAFRFVQPPR